MLLIKVLLIKKKRVMGIVMLLYECEYCMWFQVLLLIKVYYISNDCAVVEFSGI